MNPTARPAVRSLPAEVRPPMADALDQIASEGCGGVTVICGFPASGKSTAAKYLAAIIDAVIIDKDSFAPDLEESVMTELTGNPHDKDSATYMRVVNPHIYAAFVHQALMVGHRVPVVVDAPFLGHVQTAAARGLSLSEQITSSTSLPAPPVRTVWVSAHPLQIRERMTHRGAHRDSGKLANWDDYRANVLESGVEDAARTVVDYVARNY
ncbi:MULTISPECIES: AAA family ATPase [unclassified Nocardia]|uniref:AAA family ATPase n=1 Tax=unclassified Nocardia TaxID=2637762 RepID=UPI0024A80F40|nr:MULTISPECIES: AAA family ATPase [unclassified Nocardia]